MSIVNTRTEQQFLFGYPAQGVYGPIFTMAIFMVTRWLENAPFSRAIIASQTILLFGFLLISAINHIWQSLIQHSIFIEASAGINAAVIGFLCFALYDQVFTGVVHSDIDLGIVIIGFSS
jgi:chromate transporter